MSLGPVMVDIKGTSLEKDELSLLQHPNVGGLLLFTRNYEDKAQLRELIRKVRSVRPDILIAVDHEGGKVQRFRKEFTVLPPASEYGKQYDQSPKQALQLAEENGYQMAKELIDCGVDISLAPVIDVDGPSQVIGGLGRAFHADPEILVEIARAFVQGMNRAGMQATGKHYPGHGTCQLDSHVAKPIDDRSQEALEQDLKPFRLMAHDLAALMPAHVVYPAVDAEHPAGFSKRWLQQILRDDIGFKGLVMSDCLSMEGAKLGSARERAEKALEAGCDMVIMSHLTRAELIDTLENLEYEISAASKERIEAMRADFSLAETARKRLRA